MTRNTKWLMAGTLVVMGLLQAWDSGAGSAGGLVWALVGGAIALPALALLLTERAGPQAFAVVAAGVLTLTARLVSPVPLPELALVAFVAAILVLGPRLIGVRVPQS